MILTHESRSICIAAATLSRGRFSRRFCGGAAFAPTSMLNTAVPTASAEADCCAMAFPSYLLGGRKTAQEKKIKFLGTEVPRNFSDQCSLDFAYFLCLFSGRRAKSSQELCSWELFFLILGGFSPSDLCFPGGLLVSQKKGMSANDLWMIFCFNLPEILSKVLFIFSSEVSKRGWRTEGVVAEKSFLRQRLRPFFCTLLLCSLRRRGRHFWRTLGCFCGALFVASPLPPTPFRNF